MNQAQQAYVVCLLALWLVAHRYKLPMVWLSVNCAANLAICGAMDIGVLAKTDARIWMMIADLATGAALLSGGALSRIVACGYAISVPAYAFGAAIGISDSTTFAVVYATAFAQLGVVAIGSGRGGGRRNGGRLDDDSRSLATSPRNYDMASRSGNVGSRVDKVQG